ncbi:sigma-54 dependent transcriptional regulator [bacterium]|nr:sigma-54 dependent transcriptional regulator [bacterium]
MMKAIIAEKERAIRRLAVSVFEKKGFDVTRAEDGHGLETLLQERSDVLYIDTAILDSRTLSSIRIYQEFNPSSVIILSVHDIANSHLGIFSGPVEVIYKPFTDKEIESALNNACEKMPKLDPSIPEVHESVYLDLETLPSIKSHPGMKKAVSLIKSVAASDITVLISGESGVGKEVFARTLHSQSLRADKPLIAINCASVPSNLLEAELFGSEKGAYTGSSQRRLGKFEAAQNGSILLDEISEMDLTLQSKLLRVIQEKEIYRIGGNEKINLDVRLVAMTNRDLKTWVEAGNFREDLFYRLNVISIHIPPLRERVDDVPVLAEHFIARFNRDNPGRNLKLTDDALKQLKEHTWPGNVRELENILLRSAFLTKGSLMNRIYFDENQARDLASIPLSTCTLDEMERMMIQNALGMHDGNRVRAAKQLGISVRTLRNKLRQYREENKTGAPLIADAGDADEEEAVLAS